MQLAPETSEIETKEMRKNMKAYFKKNPLDLIAGEYLKIKTKDGQAIYFKLNRAQQALFNFIVAERKAKRPVRVWVLKARQEGISTLSEAIIYCLTAQQENRTSLIMANEKDNSNNLFDISKLYQEFMEEDCPHLVPTLQKSNEKKLEFERTHSQVIIQTAEKRDKAGRSYAFQYVHLSEVAFFADLRAVMTGLGQAIPSSWDTMIIGETTANGMEAFYDEWIKAIEGKTSWTPFFVPWYWMDEYSMELNGGQLMPPDGINFGKDENITSFLDDERDLRIKYKLTKQQLNWRRWKITNDCNGNIRVFKQEFPICWQEAFQITGQNFFNNAGMLYQNNFARVPKAVGELFKIDMKYQFREVKNGDIEVYEFPIRGDEYLLTADASEAVGKDAASIFVGNKRTNETAAVVYGQYTPNDQAEICIALANYYNGAMCAPETKGYGTQLTASILRVYGNVYYRGDETKDIDPDKFGFLTSTVTRPQMLGMMNQEIKDKSTKLTSKRLISECNTFITKFDRDGNAKKVEGAAGKQDGLVICRAIFSLVRNKYPYIFKKDSGSVSHKAIKYAENKRNSYRGVRGIG